MSVLVTGASGFVGQTLCTVLKDNGYDVVASVRSASSDTCSDTNKVVVGEVGSSTNWSAVLEGVETVVHLAARVHVMKDTAQKPLQAYRRINVEGSERLARQAAESGTKRLIYVSSIKVNGQSTSKKAFGADDTPNPCDNYSRSKWEAEQRLRQVADETGLQVVIVRPPLIYGPGVGGNFLRLLELVSSGVPLPFGYVSSYRSLVGIHNFCDFLKICLAHPAAPGQTFLVSDGADMPTRDLIARIARTMNKPTALLPVPVWLLYLAGKLFRKAAEIERLCASLQIDIEKATRILHWKPPFALDEELQRTIHWYLNRS